MVDYHMYCEIKRLYHEEKLNSNQIGKRLGINQKTAIRWIRRERFINNKRETRKSVLLPYKKRIEDLLSKHEYSAQQLFSMIKEEGYRGCYSNLSHYVAKVRPSKKAAYLTLHFEAGEAGQVDFASCGHINLAHTRRRLYVFIMTLCHSRMMYIEFIYKQSQEHFLQCHRNAFEYFTGVPEKIMVDNCKVAVLEHSYYGDIKLNPKYLDFSEHYGFRIKACNVRAPNEKGRVENAVSYIKGNFLNGLENITSLEAINNAARYWMENTANVRIHKTTKQKVVELFEIEKQKLIPLNLRPYDCSQIEHRRADSQFRVSFEGNKYSVPADFASTVLNLKIHPKKLLFYYNDKLIAEHIRSYDKNCDFENPEHVKKLLEYKKNAKDQKMMQSFLLICDNAAIYYDELKEKRLNAKSHIRRIMALFEIYGQEKLARAINDALELGAFSSEYIANILEQRERIKVEVGALHVTRKSDYLDISLGEIDLDCYTKLEKGN